MIADNSDNRPDRSDVMGLADFYSYSDCSTITDMSIKQVGGEVAETFANSVCSTRDLITDLNSALPPVRIYDSNNDARFISLNAVYPFFLHVLAHGQQAWAALCAHEEFKLRKRMPKKGCEAAAVFAAIQRPSIERRAECANDSTRLFVAAHLQILPEDFRSRMECMTLTACRQKAAEIRRKNKQPADALGAIEQSIVEDTVGTTVSSTRGLPDDALLKSIAACNPDTLKHKLLNALRKSADGHVVNFLKDALERIEAAPATEG